MYIGVCILGFILSACKLSLFIDRAGSQAPDWERVKPTLNAISKEKHSPRRHEGHEEKQKQLMLFWFPSWSLEMSRNVIFYILFAVYK